MGISVGLFIFLKWVLKQGTKKVREEQERYDFGFLAKEIKKDIAKKRSINLSRLNISRDEMKKREYNRKSLRRSVKLSPYGDKGSRDFLVDEIKSLLQKKYNITEQTIHRTIPFDDVERLSNRDKFHMVLYHYAEKLGHGNKALTTIILQYHLDELKKNSMGILQYLFTEEDLTRIYDQESIKLDFPDQLELLARKIFSVDYGNGVIDELIYQNIDGVSGGCSGLTQEMEELTMGYLDKSEIRKLQYTKDAVWIMFRGKAIHLSCLSFGTNAELERVTKNVCNYKAPGHFNSEVGYMVNRLKLDARVTSMRPPFTSNWVFWIRLFGSTEHKTIQALYPQKGYERLERLLYFIIRGEQTSIISGPQGVGKTTLIEALIAFVNPTYTIRTIELVFELFLQRIYHWLNIAALCGTKSITTDMALEAVRKTDADTIWFGELTKESEGEKMIKISQISKFTCATIHTITAHATVKWLRNALVYAGFSDQIAEQQVVESIRFDIHPDKNDNSKERFIERITEIVPKERIQWSNDPLEVVRQDIISRAEGSSYNAVNIMEYQDGEYKIVNKMSPSTCQKIIKHLTKEEVTEFKDLMGVDDAYIYGMEAVS